jgi:transposase
MKGLMLSQKEQARLETLNRVLEGRLLVREAAMVLGVSERHTWRMLAAYRQHGAAALAHGNRGRRPANATPTGIAQQMIELARTRYAGVNYTHLTELLKEQEGLDLSRSTVRSILLNAGMTSPRRRRPPRHRVRRRRFPQEGMLLQIDGSIHHWLEDRGPQMALLLAVDDATGTVPGALFHAEEDSDGYFRLLWKIIESRGIPLSLYTDHHGVFWYTHQRREQRNEEPSADKRKPTQFGRAMRELGIEQVFAWSPQAKGRVERVAGTFQDRLVTELRLADVRTLEEANRLLEEYLPRYNEQFGVPAADEGSAYRPLPPKMDLADVLCFKHQRKVARDNTVKYQWRTLQLLPDQDRRSYAGRTVEVWERLDGELTVLYEGQEIATQEAPPRASVLRGSKGDDPYKDRTKFMEQVEACLPAAPKPVKKRAVEARGPTRRMQAYWEAIHEAKRRGLSLREIARELGVSRSTVMRYVKLEKPPVYGEVSLEEKKEQRLTESLVSSP